MRALQLFLMALVLSLLSPPAVLRRATPPPSLSATAAGYGHLPMRFEENMGQLDDEVRFVARGSGATLFLTEEGATLSLRATRLAPASKRSPGRAPTRDEPGEPDAVLRMRVAGARAVVPRAEKKLVTISNYFLGNDPGRWRTHVPNFGRVVYPGVLPGVDLVYHGEEGQLEYDFVVAPGADSHEIVMDVSGAKELSLTSKGDLVIHTEQGVLVQPRPRVYQHEINGGRKDVAAGYRLLGESSVGFVVASHDRGRELVIDPVLQYSTYLGGAGSENSTRIAVDSAGGAYVTGQTQSVNFPRQNPFQAARAGSSDVFVAKLSPAGNALEYSTYLGGSGTESGSGIAVDGAGSAYVTGQTQSVNFPVQNPLQAATAGSSEGFIFKLSPAGNALVYSTYLGGASDDYGIDVAVDGAGSAYVAGETLSTNFPVQSPFQATRGGSGDAFVAKLSPSGNALVYSTYLGGTLWDSSYGIAVDGAGSAYVTGYAQSVNFPTQNPFQAVHAGGLVDMFVAKLSPAGNALVYSTYLGGSEDDYGNDIAVDAAGSAYVTGQTQSVNFPVQNPFQAARAGSSEGFIFKLSPAGNALVYSTYLGGSGDDFGFSIAVDGAGSAHVTGWTDSADFPVQNPFQAAGGGVDDAFVTRLSPAGDALFYSTYLGGSSYEEGQGIAVDGAGSAYVTGITQSLNFPTQNPFQAAHAGGNNDLFVAKLVIPSPPPPLDAGLDASDASADASDASVDAAEVGVVDASPVDASPGVDSGAEPSSPVADGSADASTSGGFVDGGGCGCRSTGAPAGSGAAGLALLALASLAAWRRRESLARP